MSNEANVVEQIEERANEVLQRVTTGYEHFSRLRDQLADVIAQQQQHVATLDSELTNANESVPQITGLVDEATEVATTVSAELMEGVTTATSILGTAISAFRQSLEAGREQAQEVVTSHQEVRDQIIDALRQGDECYLKVETGLEEQVARAEGWFQSFVASLQTLETQFNEQHASAEAAVTQFGQEVDSRFRSTFDGDFSALNSAIDAQLVQQLTDQLSNLESQLESFSGDLDQEITDLAENFSERVSGVFDELQEYARDQFTSQIADSIENLMKDVVASFMAEIVESIVMTEAGAATTSTLSPMLPYLAAAKAALGTIRKMMDMIKF